MHVRLGRGDAGAQRAAGLLDLRDGQRVLDACAAPGGKSAHILEAAGVALTALVGGFVWEYIWVEAGQSVPLS
mgnify:CR=1 FL=1